jgi:hypothetical protein
MPTTSEDNPDCETLREKLARIMYEAVGFSFATAEEEGFEDAVAMNLSRTRLFVLQQGDGVPSDPDEETTAELLAWDEDEQTWSDDAEESTIFETLAEALEWVASVVEET